MAERDDDERNYDDWIGREGPGSDRSGRSGSGSSDSSWSGDPADPGRPEKKSWRERIFSNQSARWLATRAPYSQLRDHPSQGRLVNAVREFGWQISDEDDEADALLVTAPFRISGFRAGNVVRGRFEPFAADAGVTGASTQWSFLAFDAVEDSRLGRTSETCFTAVPTMLRLPALRILPARFLTGPARGMKVFPTVDPIFDARFKLLARDGAEELDALTRLMTDEVRSVLAAGDDREEIWTIEGQLVVSTSQPHDEELLARHLEILGALLRAIRSEA